MDEVRLIDANALKQKLIEAANNQKGKSRFDRGESWGFELAAKMVDYAPTIDPVEQPPWRAPDEEPTIEIAGPNGDVLAIHKDDGYPDRWFGGTVVCHPENFYCWMPMPQAPDLKKEG